MLSTVTLAESHHLGLDPTIHMCSSACTGKHADLSLGALGWVEDNRSIKYSIMEILWKSHELFCRGIVCYHIINGAGNEYALKDRWVPKKKKNYEATILEMLKGIPNVIQLVDHWDVLYKGQPDCTECIHSQYDLHH
jgi:hypothetical protein